MYIENVIKIQNSLLAIFDKIPCTIYSTWSLAQFGAALKIHKNPILIGIIIIIIIYMYIMIIIYYYLS